ncbi:M15 family metallopeptidase [Acidovorax sp. JHL-9]|uniref:M15 family metallopeptidase n=1 Tax=Acidovorax sp. JHL-9 TaxID=1276756 RepID=UPI00047D86FE|nr:M15 family metallopeptidase [Acidovorax sp. JHL-9]
MHIIPHTPRFPCRTYWLSLAAGISLAACVQSPQSAVSGQAPLPAPMAWSVAEEGCAGGERLRAALASARSELQDQGLVLKTACQASHGALAVQVEVANGLLASKVVRGPLAEGEAVDMGTPAGVGSAAAASHSTDFSPDVQHNRQWLRAFMARHQLDNLPDAWWRYAQKKAAPSAVAEVDLAAR